MKTFQVLGLLVLGLSLTLVGCKNEATDKNKDAGKAADKEYDFEGKVVDIGADKKSVTVDHKEIIGLMKAMEMNFPVEDPKLLEGIAKGDQVRGRLKVKSGEYIVTQLKKQ